MKSHTPSFVIELGLKTGEDQESALETCFSDARQLFNAVLGTAKKRVRAMKASEEWKLTAAMPKSKDRNKRFKEIQKSARLSEYALHDVVKEHRAKGGFTKRIGINEAQKIATRVWQDIERRLLHQGGQPRFKSAKRGLHSVEGKSNKTRLRWKAKTWTLEVLDLVIKAEAPDAWQKEALLSATDPSGFKRVKYCRLVRRMIRGRMRCFVQLIVEGVPPVKHVYAPKDLKVAVDPGPMTMTFYSPEWQQKILVSAGTVSQEKEIARLLRAMDRDVAAAMNLYFADPATDSYDLKAEQSALARLKQVSGNAGSIVQYKPANRQDEAVLRRNRRIELMKPVPVERLRFKWSCGAGDARADEALKPLPVAGKPAPCQETPRLRRGLFSAAVN